MDWIPPSENTDRQNDFKRGSYYVMSIRDQLYIYELMKAKNEMMEKVFHANSNQKITGDAILISDKINLKSKTIIRNKDIV